MVKVVYDPRENQRLLEARVDELRTKLDHVDPNLLAARTDVQYEHSEAGVSLFRVPFFGREIKVTHPDYQAFDSQTGETENVANQAMIIYHFVTSDGTLLANEWIAFSELPDGRFYNLAFQGYTGREIVAALGGDLRAFEVAAENSGGRRAHFFGDVAYQYQLLPRVPLMVVFWAGDDDFPSSVQILFDASIGHHLPTDACAIAGSMLTRRIIKAGG
ncbi:MAG: DUF3786 domain-containing protein [Anaerolineales bacterium]